MTDKSSVRECTLKTEYRRTEMFKILNYKDRDIQTRCNEKSLLSKLQCKHIEKNQDLSV